MHFIDSHAHLNDPRFYEREEEIVQRALDAGVEVIVNIGTNLRSSRRVVELADQFENLYATVGLHPHEASDCTPAMLDEFRQMTELETVVAVGEVGLDFHYDNSPRPVQKTVFADFIHLAAETDMPLVVHSREAEQATVDLMREHMADGQRAVLHCFGSDLNFARFGMERGLLFGVGGTLTFPKAGALRSIIDKVPLEQIILETDCPYLAPQPKRGKTNEPAYIPMIADELAQLKGVDIAEVADVTTANSRAFYGL